MHLIGIGELNLHGVGAAGGERLRHCGRESRHARIGRMQRPEHIRRGDAGPVEPPEQAMVEALAESSAGQQRSDGEEAEREPSATCPCARELRRSREACQAGVSHAGFSQCGWWATRAIFFRFRPGLPIRGTHYTGRASLGIGSPPSRCAILAYATPRHRPYEKCVDLLTTRSRLRYIWRDGARGPMSGDRPGFIFMAIARSDQPRKENYGYRQESCKEVLEEG